MHNENTRRKIEKGTDVIFESADKQKLRAVFASRPAL